METLARTQLRRFGNSTGMVVPKAVLNALNAREGDRLDLHVEEGRLVATRPGDVMTDGVLLSAAEAEALQIFATEVGDAADRMIAKLDATIEHMRKLREERPAREAELRARYEREFRGEADGLFEALAR